MRRSGTIWHLSDLYQQGFLADEIGLSYKFHFKDVDGYDGPASRKQLGLFIHRPIIFTPAHSDPINLKLAERWAANVVVLPQDAGINRWLNVWRRARDQWDHRKISP